MQQPVQQVAAKPQEIKIVIEQAPSKSAEPAPAPKPKTLKDELREEAQNLDTPAQSVEFLNYYNKHNNKVEMYKGKIHRLAGLTLFIGAIGLVWCVMNYMTMRANAKAANAATGSKHRLSSGMDDFVNDEG